MKKPKHHIFICGSYRVAGEPRGICRQKGSLNLLQYFQEELSDRGMNEVMVSSTGCLKLCDHGPVMVVYPEGFWYGNVTQDVIDEILDGLEKGQAVEKYLIP